MVRVGDMLLDDQHAGEITTIFDLDGEQQPELRAMDVRAIVIQAIEDGLWYSFTTPEGLYWRGAN
jgi:hypothetical protein